MKPGLLLVLSSFASVAVPSKIIAQACTGFDTGEIPISAGRVLQLPQGTTSIVLAGQLGTPLAAPVSLTAIDVLTARWTPLPADIQRINAATPFPTLVVTIGANRCLISMTTDAAEVVSATPRVAANAYSILEACRVLGAAEEATQRRRGQEATLLIFADRGESSEGEPCHLSTKPPVVGRTIRIGVLLPATGTATTFTSVSFEPCALEDGAPLIFQTESRLSGFQNRVESQFEIQWLSSRKCYNQSVSVAVSGQRSGEDVRLSYALQQHLRYRATLQTGVLFSRDQVRTFALRPDGDNSRIFDQGPTNRGPEYTATLVLYGLPKYLQSLVPGSAHYSGRDIVNEQDVFDRIGGVVGVGLAHPGDHFVAGFSFEVVTGVNAVFARHWSRGRELAGGLSEGDVFTGAADAIPTRRVWASAWEWGLALDLRYVTKLSAR